MEESVSFLDPGWGQGTRNASPPLLSFPFSSTCLPVCPGSGGLAEDLLGYIWVPLDSLPRVGGRVRLPTTKRRRSIQSHCLPPCHVVSGLRRGTVISYLSSGSSPPHWSTTTRFRSPLGELRNSSLHLTGPTSHLPPHQCRSNDPSDPLPGDAVRTTPSTPDPVHHPYPFPFLSSLLSPDESRGTPTVSLHSPLGSKDGLRRLFPGKDSIPCLFLLVWVSFPLRKTKGSVASKDPLLVHLWFSAPSDLESSVHPYPLHLHRQ